MKQVIKERSITKHVFLFFLSFILYLSSNSLLYAAGLGQCHETGEVKKGNPNITWAYSASVINMTWSVLEPQPGQFNFTPVDELIAMARANKKKLWLQVLVSNPDSPNTYPTIPKWAMQPDPIDGKTMRFLNPGSPIQWDTKYLAYHERILRALAVRYEKPEYFDVIEAILIQGGGNYGEMTLWTTNCAGSSNADVLDVNNVYVREMARSYLGSETRASEIARTSPTGYVFDDYYIQSVKKIIDIYTKVFSYYPVVLQTGTGISCQHRVEKEVVDYGIDTYGKRLWLKSNGWGSFTELYKQDPANWLRAYNTRTIIALEAGVPSRFCAIEDGYPAEGTAGEYESCYWSTHANAVQHNTNAIQQALDMGVSFLCIQDIMLENIPKYPFDRSSLNARLQQNLNPALLPAGKNYVSPTPTILPQPTVTDTPTTVITNTPSAPPGPVFPLSLTAYYYYISYKNGYTIPPGINLDYNNDGKVNMDDYRIIRDAVKKR